MTILFCGIAVGLPILSPPLFAQEVVQRFTADFGYRWKAHLAGSEDLYRSQLDYGAGPKLFGMDYLISNPRGANPLFDRLELRMDSWGGEPHNTVRLEAGKEGVFDLRFDYLNAQYFHSIPSFANPFFTGGSLQSQQRYDISRRTGGFHLELRPGKTLSPFLAYRRSSRNGPIHTTLPVDLDEFRAGIELQKPTFSVLVEQGLSRYRENTTFRATSPQVGNLAQRPFGRDIVLDSYQGQDRVRGSSPFSSASFVSRPVRQLVFRGKLSYSLSDLDSVFSDRLTGNLLSLPLAGFYSESLQQGFGTAKKPNLLADFTVNWQPVSWLRLVERFHTRRRHISGELVNRFTLLNMEPLLESNNVVQLEDSASYETFLASDLNVQELQAHFSPHSRTLIRWGHRHERKQLQLSTQTVSWKRNVLILGASYDFSGRNNVGANYELGRTDRAIFRTDAVDSQSLRLRGRFSPTPRLRLSGNMALLDRDNDVATIDFNSRSRDYGLQVTYGWTDHLSVAVQYEQTRFQNDILYLVPQTFLPDRFTYRERGRYGSSFLTLSLPAKSRLDLGYSVGGTLGTFPLNLHQPLVRLEFPFTESVTLYGRWNYYDYNEKVPVFPQDYRAHLVVFGFRVSLDRPGFGPGSR